MHKDTLVEAATLILQGKTPDESLQEAQSTIVNRLLAEIDNLNRSQMQEFLLAFADHMDEMTKYASSRDQKGNPREVIKKISDHLYDAARAASGLKTGEKYGYFEAAEQDAGEYDAEGSMAKTALRTIIRNAKGLHDMLSDDENLPEHVQANLVKAEEYVVSARDYIESTKEAE
jgi:hypothetical protein